PRAHTSNPATVATPNQIFHVFLILFLLVPSSFTGSSEREPARLIRQLRRARIDLMFTVALWVYLRQTPRAPFAPLAWPAPVPLRQRRNDLCIIRHRRRRRASPARHFFTRCFVHQLGRLGRRKFHRRQPLRFTSYINGPHQIREKELHRRFGVFEFGQRHEERFHQNVPVFIVPAHSRLPFAGGHAIQFQLHRDHRAFRTVSS